MFLEIFKRQDELMKFLSSIFLERKRLQKIN